MKGKTVLVTGATGLMGSHLTRACLERGAKVIALGRSREKLESCFAQYLGQPGFAYIAADVSELPLPLKEPVDYIFHAAGPIERGVIEKYPLQVLEPNIFATKRLLDALYQQKKTLGVSGRMIIFSSATVYGGTNGLERRVTEQDTEFTEALEQFNEPYSQGKRTAEVLARAYWKQLGVDTVIGRFSYIYGYNKYHAMTAFFEFMDRAAHGEPIAIHSTRQARRDNIYVSDAVNGMLTIALKGQPGEVYNISTNAQKGGYAAVDEMARIMAELAGPPVKVVGDGPIEHLPGLILDNSKLQGLGWSLQTDLKSGIEAIFEQYKSDIQ